MAQPLPQEVGYVEDLATGIGEVILNRVRHTSDYAPPESPNLAQLDDLTAQHCPARPLDPLAEIRQPQRPVEMGPKHRDADWPSEQRQDRQS
jgi:hypothetical protein